ASKEDEKELKEEDEKEKEKDAEEVKEHVDALLANESLTEEFKSKVSTIFEAAVKSVADRRVASQTKKLAEIFTKKLKAKAAKNQAKLEEQVEGYLDYVVEEFFVENEV